MYLHFSYHNVNSIFTKPVGNITASFQITVELFIDKFFRLLRGSVVSFTIVLCQYLRHCLSLVRDVTPLTSNVAYKLCLSGQFRDCVLVVCPHCCQNGLQISQPKSKLLQRRLFFQMRCNSALGSPRPSLSWP